MASYAALQTTKRIARLPGQWRSGRNLWRGVGVLILLAMLWGGYLLVTQPVILIINNQPHPIRSRYHTVEAVIQEWGLALAPQDIISPPPEIALSAGDKVVIQLAHPVIINFDGQTKQHLTHQPTIGAVLAETGITTNPRDEILMDGQPATRRSTLPMVEIDPATNVSMGLFAVTTPQGQITAGRPAPVNITINRAFSLILNDDNHATTFYSARASVGEALQEHGIVLFPADKVTPNLNTPLSPGLEININRAKPVTIKTNNRLIETRTQAETVAGVLAQEGIALMGQDYSRPPANQIISANDTIEIVRVHESLEIAQEFIPFETQWVPDDQMQLDQQEVRQTGQTGVLKSRTRVRYENGQEVGRQLEDEWQDQEPQNRIVAYGTKIIIRTLETENGPVEYWRRIQMLTTGYSAATSGKDPDHPRYGITRSGLPAGRGIVAVDPKVIPLMTKLYVPGYGQALAGDTGGQVLGKHLDLGFNEDEEIPPMYGWRDVYILTPVPPADKIRYVLPQWPQR